MCQNGATKTTTNPSTSVLAFKPRQLQLSLLSRCPNQPLFMDKKTLFLRSVAQYLQRSGFSKTLKKLCSEAKIQKDEVDGTFFDLEDIFCKYLDKGESAKSLASNGVLDSLADRISKGNGDMDVATAKAAVNTGKKKRGDKNDDEHDKVVDSKVTKESITYDRVHIKGRFKEKKIKKKNTDSVLQNLDGLREAPDQKLKNEKNEKEKSNMDSGSENRNEVVEPEAVNESKDRKKKKKLSTDHVVDKQESDTALISANKSVKCGEKRKRDDCSTSNDFLGIKELDQGKSMTDVKQDYFETSKEDGIDKQKKSSKKRKRLSSEGDAPQCDSDKKAEEETREDLKGNGISIKLKSLSGTDENAQSKKGIKIGSSESQKTGGNVNMNLQDKGGKTPVQKNHPGGSVEPKTTNRFQRVKVDEVVFSDERLKDNSYWAKDGAENGYGAKAQEVLGQVRGRDFRHEKTKKKRGTYRGGQIDVQSHSIKFNYSDED